MERDCPCFMRLWLQCMVQVRIFDRLAFLSAFVAMLVKHKPALELPFRVRVDALATIGLPWHVQDVSTNNFV